MPLSEHEQKLLDQMERALYAEDPSFATQMKGARGRANKRALMLGGLIAAVGLALVVLGVVMQVILLGGVGFVVMIAGVAWAFRPAHPSAPVPGAPVAKKPAKAKKKGDGFMNRVEERWQRRQGEQD